MGGQAQKEPGGESEITHKIQEGMTQLNAVLRSVPVSMAATSAKLTAPVENAEGSVRELVALARDIDAMFGRSPKGETADIQKEVARMRTQLGIISQEQVAGVNQRYLAQAGRIDEQLGLVESALGNKALPEAKSAFGNAQADLQHLSEVIGTARSLFTAGAPQELVSATDRALELFNKGETARAELILKAAGVFIDNREYLTTDAGKPGAASLSRFVAFICDETRPMDEAKEKIAARALEKFGNDLTYPPGQRAADRDAIAKSGQVLGAATAQKITTVLDALFANDEIARARTLSGMTLGYLDLAAKAKGAAGLEVMKAALLRYADTGDREAAEQFGDMTARLVFGGDIGKLKSTVSSWNAGTYRSVAQDALGKTEELLDQKKYEQAGNLLTYTAMYADSISTLDLTKAKPLPGVEAIGGLDEMARALNAMERGEPVDGKDAGMKFVESRDEAMHGWQKMELERNYSELRQKFEGRVPWAKGMEPGMLPLGERRADGTYPGSLEIAKLRAYEKSGDPTLKGAAMDQLLRICGRAAQEGDADAYVKSMDALTKRLSLVSSRYFTAQMADGIDQMATAIDAIKKGYSGGAPADAAARLDKLQDGMREFSQTLRSGTGMDESVPKMRYDALCSAFKREQALTMIANQAGVNGAYASMAKGITGSMAGVSLRDSTEHLADAKKAFLNGDNARAREEYEAAMNGRQTALALFSATGTEKRAGANAAPLFDGWRKTQMAVFDGVLGGKDTKKLQDAAGLVELSVFALPENARDLGDFSASQKAIRELALSGKTAEAEAEWAGMRKTLQTQKLWTNIAMTVSGVAIGFVPGGQIISGAIFTSMATGQVIDEAAAGRVSGKTWAMLGVSVATWGLGGVVGELRTAANLARAGGKTRAAAAYGTTATALTGAGVGTGLVMGGLAMPATIQAFREGRYGEASFNLAMILFPFAHMAGAGALGSMNAARARTVAAFDNNVAALSRAPEATAPKIVEAPVRSREPQAVARRTPEEIYDNFADKGTLPADITPREWSYVQKRAGGATHNDAIAIIEGRLPSTKEKLRQRSEAHERGKAVEAHEFREPASADIEAAILERGGSRNWLIGGEEIAGEAASTGRMLRSIEKRITTLVKGGEEVDVIVVSGDKAKLNQINQLLGKEYGDRALDAYRELFGRSVYDASGDGSAFLIRPSQSGDEAIGVIIVRGGTGKDVHAKLRGAVEKNTAEVFAEYSDPAHPQSLAAVGGMLREPMDLVAEVIDLSNPVSVRRGAGGKITATDADGSDAMVTHEIETSAGRETATEFMPKLVRSADEQGSASHAPEMRMKLNSGVDTEIRKAKGISDVAEDGKVSGRSFEIRVEITDPAILADARALLPKTRKGISETLKNSFGIRGCNTFLGHYGANRVINTVETAVEDYAAAGGLTIRRLGTMKYILEGGTPQQIEALNRYVSGRLQQDGMKFRVSDEGRVGKPMENASAADALASISNGHIRVEWGAGAYEDANAFISAMAIGNDETMLRLLGSRYDGMRPLIDLIRRNPAIRNVEDLFTVLRDPILGGAEGPAMEKAFMVFVTSGRAEFRTNLGTLAPRLYEAAEVRMAAGAEEAVIMPLPQTGRRSAGRAPIELPRDAATLERTVGATPRSEALEKSITARFGTDEERAVARVLDAILSGEVKGKLPGEYQRVIDGIKREGLGEARHAAAVAERGLIAIESVQDVMSAKNMSALERAMDARSIQGDLRDDAVVLFKTIRSIPMRPDEMRMSEQDYTAVMEHTAAGASEADAVISVAAAKAASYERASDALRAAAQAAQLQSGGIRLAGRLLRWRFGRKMSPGDPQALTEEVLKVLDRKLQESKDELEAVVAAAKEMEIRGKAGAPKGFDERLEPLSYLGISVPETGQIATPWRMVSETERAQYAQQVWEIYRDSYAKAGLPYDNPGELLQRLPMWMIATDETGRVVGFTAFSSNRSGTRLGVGGAAPNSGFGRAAVRAMYGEFGKLDGVYGMVSERPAQIALRGGAPVVPFNEAQRLMGRPKGAKSAVAQRDAARIRQMDGYRESRVVVDAVKRTGRRPEELTFNDLVEQAVINRDIPDRADARGNCFAVQQNMDGKPTVLIKLMVGRPLSEKKG